MLFKQLALNPSGLASTFVPGAEFSGVVSSGDLEGSQGELGFFKPPETTMTQGLAGLPISYHSFLSSPDSEILLPWSLHVFSPFLLVSFLLYLISLL